MDNRNNPKKHQQTEITQTKSINIIQANLHKSPTAMSALQNLMLQENTDIAIVTEPPINRTSNLPYSIHLPFKALYTSDNSKMIRSIILFNAEKPTLTNLKLLPTHSLHDHITVEFPLDQNETLHITGIYLDQHNHIEDPDNPFNEVIKYKFKNWILAGDLNAESPFWGSPRINKRGKDITEKLQDTQLTSVVYKNTPTCITERQERIHYTVIDATLASSSVLNKIVNYVNSPNKIAVTDHTTISFSINIKATRNQKKKLQRRINTSTVDWTLFDKYLKELMEIKNISENSINAISKPTELNNAVKTITEIATKSIKKATPKPTAKNRDQNKNNHIWWWNEETESISNEIIATRRAMKNCGLYKYYQLVAKKKELSNKLREAVQQSKTQKWQDFMTGTTEDSIWTAIHIIRSISKKQSATQLVDKEGNLIKEEMAPKVLAQALFGLEEQQTSNESDIITSTISPSLDHAITQSPNHHLTISSDHAILASPVHQGNTPAHHHTTSHSFRLLTPSPTRINPNGRNCMNNQPTIEEPSAPKLADSEINSLFRDISPKKAPGKDKFNSEICEKIRLCNPAVLKAIYQKCLDLAIFPDEWKSSWVIPIHKEKKGTPTNPKNYRPIGLLSMLAKGLEKIINTRISYHIINNGILHPNQHGFTPTKSTISALSLLINSINQYKEKYKYCAILALDIAGAFDNLPWKETIRQLDQMNCPKQYTKILENYFINRRYEIIFGDHEYTYYPRKGCVQGSPLSPTLWNVIINPLLKEASNLTHTQAYADDVIFLLGAKNEAELQRKTQEIYKIAQKWAKKNQLSFALEKTEFLMLRGNIKEDILLEKNTTPIKQQKSIKILGVTIDRKLTWKEHLTKALMKATTIHRVMTSLCLSGMGVNSRLRKLCYNMVYVPTLTYGCEIWYQTLKLNSSIKLLRENQRKIMIRMTGAYSQSNLADLLLIAQEELIDKKIMAMSYKHMLINNLQTPLKLKTTSAETEKKEYRFAKLAPWEYPSIVIQHITREEATTPLYNLNNLRIYIKGCTSNEGTGAAYIIIKEDNTTIQRKMKLHQLCDAQQSELISMIEAITFVKDKLGPKILKQAPESNQTITLDFITKSKTLTQLLSGNKGSNPLLNNLRSLIKQAEQSQIKIKIKWTTDDLELYSQITSLAKEAIKIKKGLIYSAIPQSTIKREIKEWSKLETKKYVIDNASNNIKQILDVEKVTLDTIPDREICWTLTGKGPFLNYLHMIKKSQTNICQCNQATQTPQHLMQECPEYDRMRNEMLDDEARKLISPNYRIKSESELEKIECLIKAIIESQLQKEKNKNTANTQQ